MKNVIVTKCRICPICNNELTYYAGLDAYSCNKKKCGWVGQIYDDVERVKSYVSKLTEEEREVLGL